MLTNSFQIISKSLHPHPAYVTQKICVKFNTFYVSHIIYPIFMLI